MKYHTVAIKLSPAVLVIAHEQAREDGVSTSEYLRRLITAPVLAREQAREAGTEPPHSLSKPDQ